MHYLIHGPAAYAIVESDARAQQRIDDGWTPTTLDVVRERWLERDLDGYDRMWEDLLTRERAERARGGEGPSETAPLQGRAGARVTQLAGGVIVYDARK